MGSSAADKCVVLRGQQSKLLGKKEIKEAVSMHQLSAYSVDLYSGCVHPLQVISTTGETEYQ